MLLSLLIIQFILICANGYDTKRYKFYEPIYSTDKLILNIDNNITYFNNFNFVTKTIIGMYNNKKFVAYSTFTQESSNFMIYDNSNNLLYSITQTKKSYFNTKWEIFNSSDYKVSNVYLTNYIFTKIFNFKNKIDNTHVKIYPNIFSLGLNWYIDFATNNTITDITISGFIMAKYFFEKLNKRTIRQTTKFKLQSNIVYNNITRLEQQNNIDNITNKYNQIFFIMLFSLAIIFIIIVTAIKECKIINHIVNTFRQTNAYEIIPDDLQA